MGLLILAEDLGVLATVGGPCGPDIQNIDVVPVSTCSETSLAGALLTFPVATAVPGSVLGLAQVHSS